MNKMSMNYENVVSFEIFPIVTCSLSHKNEENFLKPIVTNFLYVRILEDKFIFPLDMQIISNIQHDYTKSSITLRSIYKDVEFNLTDYINYLERMNLDTSYNKYLLQLLENGKSFLKKISSDYDLMYDLFSKFFSPSFRNNQENKYFIKEFFLSKIVDLDKTYFKDFKNSDLDYKLIFKNFLLLRYTFKYDYLKHLSNNEYIQNNVITHFNIYLENMKQQKINQSNELYITHYSNLSYGVYSDIIKNKDVFKIIANEIEDEDYCGINLLNSLINLNVQEVNVINSGSRKIGIVFESDNYHNLKSGNNNAEISNNKITNIIYRGTKPEKTKSLKNLVCYGGRYIKTYIVDKFVPFWKDETEFEKKLQPYINESNEIIVSGHSYGAKNALITIKKLQKKYVNVRGFLMSLPFFNITKNINAEYIENYDGKIYKQSNNLTFILHKEDLITLPLKLIKSFGLSFLSYLLYYYTKNQLAYFSSISFIIIAIYNIKEIYPFIKRNHSSDWLRNHNSFFLQLKKTLMGKYSHSNELNETAKMIKLIFSTLNGNRPVSTCTITKRNESLPYYVLLNHEYQQKEEEEYKDSLKILSENNIDFKHLFKQCLINYKGANFDEFFTKEICNVLKYYNSPKLLKAELENFFQQVQKIKFINI